MRTGPDDEGPAAAPRAGEPIRVMVVEDEFLIRTVIVEQLEDAGFAVVEAADGEQALAILRRDTDLHVLLTDIRMPGEIDGWQLGRAARGLVPALRVIYVTGYSDAVPDLEEGERIIAKPYLFGDVRRELCALGVISA